MEKIFLVKNGELDEVNHYLQQGGKVKMIQAVPEIVSSYGYHSSNSSISLNDNEEKYGAYVGVAYAYIVVEFN